METGMLSVRNLSVSFSNRGDTSVVVDNISFELGYGECLGVVGESGSGKSLTARSIVRLLPRSAQVQGRILLDDEDLLALSGGEMDKIRGRQVGLVFQEPQNCLSPVWSIGEQFHDVLRTHFGMARAQSRARTRELLSEVGLGRIADRVHDYPHRFSGGELQRIVIALVLAVEPRLIILDEPTAALDAGSQAELLEMLRMLGRSHPITLLVISHDFATIAALADSILVMRQGQIVERGAAEEVMRHPRHEYTRRLLAAIPGRTLAHR
jgi:peptide/nickel transport system ATP-binding protein